jgi:hypothetical protein
MALEHALCTHWKSRQMSMKSSPVLEDTTRNEATDHVQMLMEADSILCSIQRSDTELTILLSSPSLEHIGEAFANPNKLSSSLSYQISSLGSVCTCWNLLHPSLVSPT